MSSATFESQIELDREIARLEQQLLDLKRRRNALSPISRIPPELLSNIFFLALCFLEADGVTPHKLDPNVTKQAICAVSHHWRETAFTDPKLWMEIHVRRTTSRTYLDLVRRHLRETQDVSLEAHDIDGNWFTAGHILDVEKTRLKRVVLGGTSMAILKLLQELKFQCEGVEALELTCNNSRSSAENGVLPNVARVFPRIRKLGHAMLRLPRASDMIRLAHITELVLRNLRPFTEEDVHQFFDILKGLKNLTTFTLVGLGSAANTNLSDRVVWSTEVELPRLKRFVLEVENTALLLALLEPLRFHGEMERLVIATFDMSRTELNRRVISATTIAFSHMSAPETMRMTTRFCTGSVRGSEDSGLLVAYQLVAGWVDRLDRHFQMVLPVLPDGHLGHSSPAPVYPFFTLQFMDPDCWILSNVLHISVNTRPTLSFWGCIARISTLRQLTVNAWGMDDYFLQILQDEGPSSVGDRALEVPTPFPALTSIRVNTDTLSTPGLDVDYARALAQALQAWAAGAGEVGVGKIHSLVFRSCVSQLDEVTRDLLSSVALEVVWKMRN
ncbi:hypothetical protein D9611_009886 [Ephemerocybe angulata]|uniref:F-box domain-containing protein n=1 Tax=Ephemerocybe angulata TaxID=980116 RepID=A0A8H5CF78_9AGAR|nr:hypothetical protein D9611_009886 [Tulosesus angulatus]